MVVRCLVEGRFGFLGDIDGYVSVNIMLIEFEEEEFFELEFEVEVVLEFEL